MSIEVCIDDGGLTFAYFTLVSNGGNGSTSTNLAGTNMPESPYNVYPITKIIFMVNTTGATFNSKTYSIWGVKA